MLQALENDITARLAVMRQKLPRLELRSYGGELSDGDAMADVLKAGHAVLITVPKATFTRRSNRRFAITATVRLVICSRQARGEQETRHGVAGSPGSYALWESCVRLLTGHMPADATRPMAPTEFSNLITGRFQQDFLSVLGQSFTVEGDWDVPDEPFEPITGIDLTYYLQPDDGEADARDRID